MNGSGFGVYGGRTTHNVHWPKSRLSNTIQTTLAHSLRYDSWKTVSINFTRQVCNSILQCYTMWCCWLQIKLVKCFVVLSIVFRIQSVKLATATVAANAIRKRQTDARLHRRWWWCVSCCTFFSILLDSCSPRVRRVTNEIVYADYKWPDKKCLKWNDIIVCNAVKCMLRCGVVSIRRCPPFLWT